ncbi:HNH endonuclease [Desulfogranum marinum]|uniref:HNH endonuclease n=1 Tax=Desulfogranum marinum TaxID=453220 RepID=UPI001966A1AC|nr:HNH endonuclease signature motif containing protein [Desulfogranum marinum]MBM9515280.1 HNH endonuclease [Desulfogranum marinum]
MEPQRPAFWWVNQNQTFEHERQGGYMWSPKTKSNGGRNQFYDNMVLVSPGDIVFSFAHQEIPCLGVVTSKGYEALKPQEFGTAGINWEKIGWKVDVTYFDLKNVIRPKNHIEDLRPTLPPKYSPLQSNGGGLQGVYLASVPEEMAKVLFEKIGIEATEIIQASAFSPDEGQEDKVEKLILQNKTISETEKEAVIKARRGQGLFRQNLEAIESRCRVTGITNPNHLIAGHIKPWAKCENNAERLDGENGLLLAPHIDHLFDKGYISFNDNGDLVISPFADLQALAQMGLQVEQTTNVGDFTEKQKLYLDYHRIAVFKK